MKNLSSSSFQDDSSFLLILFLSFSLNYISTLYSDFNLFKIDISEKKIDRIQEKLLFVLKNNHLLFYNFYFFQLFLNYLISNYVASKFPYKHSWVNVLIVFTTEIFSRYLALKRTEKNFFKNKFLVNFSYYLIKINYKIFSKFIKPREKFFNNSEKDVILFINNLAEEEILEKEEANLIHSALIFDETKVNCIFKPIEQVIQINLSMSKEEIEKIYVNNFFSCYPVIDSENKIKGTINFKFFYRSFLEDNNIDWKDCIRKNVIYLSPEQRLDKCLKIIRQQSSKIAFVKDSKGKILGIVTAKDIIDALIGKHDKKKL